MVGIASGNSKLYHLMTTTIMFDLGADTRILIDAVHVQ